MMPLRSNIICSILVVALLFAEGCHSFSTSSSSSLSSLSTKYSAASMAATPSTTTSTASSTSLSSTFNNNNIGETDMESSFYLFDADSSGGLDLEELRGALSNLEITVTDDQVSQLFNKYSDKTEKVVEVNGNTNIKAILDFEAFQHLVQDHMDTVSAADLPPGKEITYAMDLFRQFDKDNSGSIDKTEFLAIANKMKIDSSRRELVSVAAAAYGAYLVSEQSFEFQFAQKKLRSQYVDEAAEDSQKFNFPTAMLSSDTDTAIARTLMNRGFTPTNTLFGHSVCSDEVNNRKEQLIPLMVNRWNEGFFLGGLGGLPFSGKSGFGAYLHHVPDNGRLLIVFAPHVGIAADGRVGVLQRDGQSSVSTACGAAVGAYRALQAKQKAPTDPLLIMETLKNEDTDLFDPQIEKIVSLLAPRLQGIEDSSDSITFVTYQMYAIIRELVENIITSTPDLYDYASEVAVVGGIMINRRTGGDFFQPLSFETQRKGQEPEDLFEQAFGPRPELGPILGSDEAVYRLAEKMANKS